jgi:hypothetical protein
MPEDCESFIVSSLASIDAFLSWAGPVAVEDSGRRRRVAAEEAPEFHALSFFHSKEEIVSEMIAYLLNPMGQHGQGQLFLRTLLTAIGVSFKELRSVVVQVESPCYTLSDRRRLDILIRFTTGGAEHVVAIESKSHFAGDQTNQVHDYLIHLKTAHPRASWICLYYLKDGSPPSIQSISADEWRLEEAKGICKALSFRKVIDTWLAQCAEEQLPPAIRVFLKDFARFIGVAEEKSMELESVVRDRALGIIDSIDLNAEVRSADFEALLAIHAMHEDIWQKALTKSVQQVHSVLLERLAGWEIKNNSYFEDGGVFGRVFFAELTLWKNAEWTMTAEDKPNLYVVLATEDLLDSRQRQNGHRRPMHFDMYIRRAKGFAPRATVFNEGDVMLIGPRKDDCTRKVQLDGVTDLRSSEGIRYLLTVQGTTDICHAVVRFVQDHEEKMDALFRFQKK